jgi:tRNA 5-methylaminomethyl-2-thiouridine biosynthesis bifunctional protein
MTSDAFDGGSHVLAALRLPEAWADRPEWTLLDLDFDAGAAFVAALRAWRLDPRRCARLRWAALVHRPLDRDALRARLDALRLPQVERAALIERWPPPTPGVHRIAFESGRVQLTLALGAPRAMLPGWLPHADAVLSTVAAGACAPDATLLRAAAALLVTEGTAVVVPKAADAPLDAVRAHLDAAAAALARAGLRCTRDAAGGALRAHRTHGPASARAGRRASGRAALVIGGGLAACAAAFALARRGWSVIRVEAPGDDLHAGSWQPVLAQHPSVTPDDAHSSRLLRAATLLAAGEYDGGALRRHGRIQCVPPERAVALAGSLPREWVEPIDAAGASARAGLPLRDGGLWLPYAGSADPRALREVWSTDSVVVVRAQAARLQRHADGWTAFGPDGRALAHAAIAIVATGTRDLVLGFTPAAAPRRLHAELGAAGLQRLAGRTTIAAPAQGAAARCTIGGDGHVVPIDATRMLIGPAGWLDDEPQSPPAPETAAAAAGARPSVDDADLRAWARLAARLASTAPLPVLSPGPRGERLSTRDHLPLAGPVPDAAATVAASDALRRDDRRALPVHPDLWVATAMGGRGLLWSVLAAELIASRLDGEPLPVEPALVAALSPDRFLRRALRRADTTG